MQKIIVSLVLSTCIIYANSTAVEETSIKGLFDTKPNLAPVVQKSIPIPVVVKQQVVAVKTYSEVIEVSQSSKMPKAPNVLVRDRAKEVVIDGKSSLIWQDNGEVKTVKKDWQGARGHCQNLSFAGYSDWRLPDINELLSITDDTRYNPAIRSGFENVVSDFYWSSSSGVNDSNYAWFVDFKSGHDHYNSKDYSNYVRCVRDSK